MIETINALIILCALFVIIFMFAKRGKEDSKFIKREIELALNFYPEGYNYVNNILSGFPVPVTDKTEEINMSDFKIDDWVKHYEYGICRIKGIETYCSEGSVKTELTIVKYELEEIKTPLYRIEHAMDHEVIKVYPKFDKFDDLFSESPCYVDETKTKFKIGDKVKSSITGDEVLTIAGIDTEDGETFRYWLKGKSIGWLSEELFTKYVEKNNKFKPGDKVTHSEYPFVEYFTVKGLATILGGKQAYLIKQNSKGITFDFASFYVDGEEISKYIEKDEPKFKVGDKVISHFMEKEDFHTVVEIDLSYPDMIGYYIQGEFKHWCDEDILTKYIEKEDPKFKIGDKVTHKTHEKDGYFVVTESYSFSEQNNSITRIKYSIINHYTGVSNYAEEHDLAAYIEKEEPRFEVGERIVHDNYCCGRLLGVVSEIEYKESEYIYTITKGEETIFIGNKRIFKLNDPEIIRIYDKVKYIGEDGFFSNGNYLMKNSKLTVKDNKDKNNNIVCFYEGENIKARFAINPNDIELMLD